MQCNMLPPNQACCMHVLILLLLVMLTIILFYLLVLTLCNMSLPQHHLPCCCVSHKFNIRSLVKTDGFVSIYLEKHCSQLLTISFHFHHKLIEKQAPMKNPTIFLILVFLNLKLFAQGNSSTIPATSYSFSQIKII